MGKFDLLTIGNSTSILNQLKTPICFQNEKNRKVNKKYCDLHEASNTFSSFNSSPGPSKRSTLLLLSRLAACLYAITPRLN